MEPGHYGKKKIEHVKRENCMKVMKLSMEGTSNLRNNREIWHGSYSTRQGDNLCSNWTEEIDGPQHPPQTGV